MADTIATLPPRTLADGNRKLTALLTPPKDIHKITVAELAAGLDVSCRVMSDGTRFRAQDSDRLTEPAICEPAGAESLGAGKYEASVVPFRFFNPAKPGQADAEGDKLFTALRVKGTPVVFVERFVNKKWSEAWAAVDEYQAFSVISDNWQSQDNPKEGYIKATVPLLVQDAELNGVVATA